MAKIRSVILDPHKVGNSIKIRGVSHPLKGFYKGLRVVKGEGQGSFALMFRSIVK
ncbi:hypothetical protein CSUIS_0452 [Campylobacter porcelli]|uniref:Uncharacterized protein n=1 Tax=Campylobacter porcelli TaxID=1660073 RepID=A0A1X9SVM8_9BACT|nr:hypothetical protein CSUIS_0452 [Campylobacter sp. RM6137]